MDFTEMPESLGYNYILVVVDWFSKEVVFVLCTKEVLNINYCCGLFTDYISARAHYSRLCSTLVPSVACQTTEGEYLLLTIPTTY